MLLETNFVCLSKIGFSLSLISSNPVVISDGGVHNKEHVHDLEELVKPNHRKEK
jgi:hypothetical protein